MARNIEQVEVASRIRFLIQQLNMSQAQFARRIGIDPANMSKHLNGKLPITSGLINRIAVDLGVSKHWLSTGQDLPFAKSESMVAHVAVGDDAYAQQQLPMLPGIPIYDVDVTAGCTELSRQFTTDKIIGSMNLPTVSRQAVIVRVNGDSMEPEILDGSFVAIREVSDMSCLFWGQIYVVVLDDFRVVKHVRRNDDASLVTLHSANALYDDMVVPLKKIRKLYLVEAILNVKLRC